MPQMDPDRVAREGLRALRRGQATHVPGLLNRLSTLTPKWISILMWKILLARLVPANLLPGARPAAEPIALPA